MPPANARPTLKDVAKAAGVSPQAVSLVINKKSGVSKETRGHIEAIIQKLNYTPHAAAQAMRSASTRTLAFIYAGTQSGRLSASGYLEEILNGVLASANQHGYHLLLYALQLGSDAQQLQDLTGRCDGLVVVGSLFSEAQLSALETISLPLVEIQRETERGYSVRAADEAGISSAVSYLSRRGHKRIAYLGRSLTKYTSRARQQGYVKGLEQNNVEFSERLIRYVDHGDAYLGLAHNNTLEHEEITKGLELTLDLLGESPAPTAVICFDDLLAVGALRAAKLRKLKVPDDLAVIGFNNFSMAAATTPPLTTIDFPAYQLGATATDMLVKQVRNEPIDSREVVIPVTLFTRETV